MGSLDEALARLAAYPLGGRIGGNEARILRLQLFQTVHQLVELGVGYLGSIENVIEVFVVANLVAQLFNVLGRHRKRLYSEERIPRQQPPGPAAWTFHGDSRNSAPHAS